MKIFKTCVFLGILTLASSGCANVGPGRGTGFCADSLFGGTAELLTGACTIKKMTEISTGGASPGHGAQSEQDLANQKFQEIAEREGRKPPPKMQSSAPACPGWALVHHSLKYPMPKAIEIIEKQTTAKASWLDYDLGPEMLEASRFIHQTCDHPDPNRDYTKLSWVCPQGDPECVKKNAFAEEYDALQGIGDQALGFQKFKELLQKYKG